MNEFVTKFETLEQPWSPQEFEAKHPRRRRGALPRSARVP